LIERFSMVMTDPGGRFRCEGIGPGDYSAAARKDGEASPASGMVRVQAEQDTSVDMVLSTGTLLEVVVLVVSGGALVVVEVVEVVVVAGTGSEPPPQPAATSTTASSAGSHVLTATTLRQCARYQRAAFGNQAVMPKRSRPKQSMALPRMSL
jgi:hypothetical protein